MVATKTKTISTQFTKYTSGRSGTFGKSHEHKHAYRALHKMVLLFSRMWDLIVGNKEVRILILGLDNAGKTTILYNLHSPEAIVKTMTTIGFNVETVTYKNIKFQVWDLGGQTNIRPYWRCYYPNTKAIIFVVDSADVERLEIARKELMSMLEEDELKETCILVFANKQDMKGALSDAQVSQGLGLTSIRDRQWHICKATALKGEGLHEGLDWLCETIANR